MNKEKYEHTVLEVIKFQTEDVILTSPSQGRRRNRFD